MAFGVDPRPLFVIARFKRAIQYPQRWRQKFELSRTVVGYWIARSSRAMTANGATPTPRYPSPNTGAIGSGGDEVPDLSMGANPPAQIAMECAARNDKNTVADKENDGEREHDESAGVAPAWRTCRP
jgi:hypothetical protein